MRIRMVCVTGLATMLALGQYAVSQAQWGDFFRNPEIPSNWGSSGGNNGWGGGSAWRPEGNGNWGDRDGDDGPSGNFNWVPLVNGVISGLGELERNSQESNRRQYSDGDDGWYEPQYRSYPRANSRPRSNPPPVRYSAPKPVRVQANAKPKPPMLKPLSNTSPVALALSDPLDPASYALARQLVDEQVKTELNNLESSLPQPVANSSNVQTRLADFKSKIDNGQPITEADKQAFRDLVDAEARAKGVTVDSSAVNSRLDTIQAQGTIASIFSTPFPSSWSGTIPTGTLHIICLPGFPSGSVALLPSGDLLVGGGPDDSVWIEQGTASDVFGLPFGVGEPEPEDSSSVTGRVASGVLLLNPTENGTPIHYDINGTSYTMQPGYTQTLPAGTSWTIRFDRGEGNNEARYTLKDGSYYFASSDKGWELYRKTYSVTIDNRENEQEFRYTLDNQQASVAARQTALHTSDYPIFVRFDRGDGAKDAQKKVTERNETLKVAVNPRDNLWDLFPGSGPDIEIGQSLLAERKEPSLDSLLLDDGSKGLDDPKLFGEITQAKPRTKLDAGALRRALQDKSKAPKSR